MGASGTSSSSSGVTYASGEIIWRSQSAGAVFRALLIDTADNWLLAGGNYSGGANQSDALVLDLDLDAGAVIGGGPIQSGYTGAVEALAYVNDTGPWVVGSSGSGANEVPLLGDLDAQTNIFVAGDDFVTESEKGILYAVAGDGLDTWAVGSVSFGAGGPVPVFYDFRGLTLQKTGIVAGFDGGLTATGSLGGVVALDGYVYLTGTSFPVASPDGGSAISDGIVARIPPDAGAMVDIFNLGSGGVGSTLGGITVVTGGDTVDFLAAGAGDVAPSVYLFPLPSVDVEVADAGLLWSTTEAAPPPPAGNVPDVPAGVVAGTQGVFYVAVATAYLPDGGDTTNGIGSYVARVDLDQGTVWRTYLGGTFNQNETQQLAIDSTGLYVATTAAVYKLKL